MADPRVTKTAMMADLHLPLKPRSDLALINGIAHILIRDGLIDRDYIDKAHDGFRGTGSVSSKSTRRNVSPRSPASARRPIFKTASVVRQRQGRVSSAGPWA